MKRAVTLLFLLIFVFSSCKKDIPVLPAPSDTSGTVSSETEMLQPEDEVTGEMSPYTYMFYGRSILGEDLKKVYDKTALWLKNFRTSVPVSEFSLTESDVGTVVNAVLRDDPYLFHVKNDYTLTVTNGKVTEIKFGFSVSEKDYAEMCLRTEKECDGIVSSLSGKSDFQKCIGVHDALCRKVSYVKGENPYDAYGALVKGEAVCQGYTEAAMLLLYKLGIPVIFTEGKFGGNSHSWVMVNLSGEWYHMDITADDPVNCEKGKAVFHTFSLLSDEEMKGSHSFEGYPKAESRKENYYVEKGLYMAEWNRETLCGLIADAKKSGEDYIGIRFGTQKDLETAKARFSSGDLGKGIKAVCGEDIKLSNVSLSMNYGIYDITFSIE